MGEPVRESCREWIDAKNDRCNAPADYLIWGKLFGRDALGPRCWDCAAKHVPSTFLAGKGLEQSAIFDLRGLERGVRERGGDGD